MSRYKFMILLKKLPSLIFQIFIALLILLPVGWMVLSSFRPPDQIASYPPAFFPATWTLKNFKDVAKVIPFFTYMKNTIIYTVVVTFFSVLFNSMAGYAFARKDFKGKNVLFTILLASMMIPFQVIMVPLFMEIYYMNMLDKFSGLVIPKFAAVVGIFFMRSYFTTLPKQLEEAAKLDGLREFGIFFRIMLPLCGPAIITQVILTLNTCWNDLLWPLLMTCSPEKRLLANGITFFIGQRTTLYGPAFAAGVLAVIPLFCVYIFGQKYFVNSIVSTGIKG